MMKNGSEPMITADALASWLTALIFAFIFLRSRSTLDRLFSASARLPPVFALDRHDDGEEIHFRQRHALVHALDALVDGDADALALDDLEKLRTDRSGRFPRR